MMKAARLFVASLKSILQNRLPADEFEQILDECNWEFERLQQGAPGGRKGRTGADARFCSLCLSFYRAMLSVGMDRHAAAGTISEASTDVDWVPVRIQDAESCPVVRYFSAQGAVDLCESAFCRKCPCYPGGCSALRAVKADRG
jgi:hypothetical protein